jgi:predicted DNA binding CopG/RHH family protein
MDQNKVSVEKDRHGDSSVVIGLRLPKETATAIKQEAARRNIRLNRLMMELWEAYQQEKKGS